MNKKSSTASDALAHNSRGTNRMRVLLYDVESSRYYESPVKWTSDPRLARDLRGTVQAVTVAFENRLKTAEIILAFDENHLRNMHLPLRVSESYQGGNGGNLGALVSAP